MWGPFLSQKKTTLGRWTKTLITNLQVIQRHNLPERQRSKGNSSQFYLPQILVLIFKFLSGCEDVNARTKIVGDLLELLDSNISNIEAFMVRHPKIIFRIMFCTATFLIA